MQRVGPQQQQEVEGLQGESEIQRSPPTRARVLSARLLRGRPCPSTGGATWTSRTFSRHSQARAQDTRSVARTGQAAPRPQVTGNTAALRPPAPPPMTDRSLNPALMTEAAPSHRGSARDQDFPPCSALPPEDCSPRGEAAPPESHRSSSPPTWLRAAQRHTDADKGTRTRGACGHGYSVGARSWATCHHPSLSSLLGPAGTPEAGRGQP